MTIPTKEAIYKVLCNRHTKENQDKLMQAKVAIAGLGGLGSNVAVALARVGIGQLHLIDFDKVDLSNLNRQHYFINHLGMNKTDALAEQLLQINPYLHIIKDCIKLTENNITDLLKDDDYICEAFDVPENKAMLVNTVLEQFPEKNLWQLVAWQALATAMPFIHAKSCKIFICVAMKNAVLIQKKH